MSKHFTTALIIDNPASLGMRGVLLTRLLVLVFLSGAVYGTCGVQSDSYEGSDTEPAPGAEFDLAGAEESSGESESDDAESDGDASVTREESLPAEESEQTSPVAPSQSPNFILNGSLGGLTVLFISGVLFEFIRVVLLVALVAPMLARRSVHREDDLTKGRILGYIEANAGIHFSALRDGLGLANGVTAYHTHNLESEGSIFSWKDGKHRRYASSLLSNQDRARFQNPLSGTRLAILEVLAESGQLGTTGKELREKLAISRQLLSHHIRELQANQLIEQGGGKRAKQWKVSGLGLEQLAISKTLPQ